MENLMQHALHVPLLHSASLYVLSPSFAPFSLMPRWPSCICYTPDVIINVTGSRWETTRAHGLFAGFLSRTWHVHRRRKYVIDLAQVQWRRVLWVVAYRMPLGNMHWIRIGVASGTEADQSGERACVCVINRFMNGRNGAVPWDMTGLVKASTNFLWGWWCY